MGNLDDWETFISMIIDVHTFNTKQDTDVQLNVFAGITTRDSNVPFYFARSIGTETISPPGINKVFWVWFWLSIKKKTKKLTDIIKNRA